MRNLKKFLALSALSIATISISSCSDDEYVDTGIQFNGKLFSIVANSSSGSYILGYDQTDIANINNTIPFNSSAYQLPSNTTTKIITSSDGLQVYALNANSGTMFKYKTLGANNYTLERSLNINYALGTNDPNVIKIDDSHALLTYLLPNLFVNKLRLALINLDELAILYNEELILPANENGEILAAVNSALVHNSKIYLGVRKDVGGAFSNIQTLVVDYPSLTNPRYIASNYTQPINGFTSGEFIPTMHLDENYSIFQIVNVESSNGQTHIVKINEDVYNPSFNFNLDLLLGEETYAKGWFYVGNGIGYVPYLRKSLGNEDSNNWAIARVDLYNHTATQLNLPQNINLKNCRQAVSKANKLYIAIAGDNQPGNVYVMDALNPSPDGFVVGANLEAIPGGNYLGIY